MDRAKAEELLTDMLAGEISPCDLDKLLQYEEQNPDFVEYRQDAEVSWGMSEETGSNASVDNSRSVSKIISKVSDIIYEKRQRKVIDLDTLNLLSAAGSEAIINNNKENTDTE